MVDRRTEPLQGREMLRHRIAHVTLEAVAGIGGADLHHQPGARDLGDNRCGSDRKHQRIARDYRLAIAGNFDAIAAVDLKPGDAGRALAELRAAGVVLATTDAR